MLRRDAREPEGLRVASLPDMAARRCHRRTLAKRIPSLLDQICVNAEWKIEADRRRRKLSGAPLEASTAAAQAMKSYLRTSGKAMSW